jgi:16S rRNA (cytosine967-C5)-methyltransferase
MSSERARAIALLQRIERESLYASLVLLHESGFVRTLVLGVLRWRSRLDFVIEHFAQRPLKKLDPIVVDVLRLGTYQLLFMDVPKYAAVSETVDLTPKRARGFVNAILRRASEGKAPEPNDLATRTAHPQWLIDRWTNFFGAERAAKIAEANQELSYPDVLSLEGDAPPDAEPSKLVRDVWKLHGSSADLDRDRFYPMDEGSAVIADIARSYGDDILDLAAAPGGKTIYMTHRGARVIANDISIARIRLLKSRDARVVVADGRQPPLKKKFDVVLLDAPCSATGTIRKNPEIKWRLREQDLGSFAKLQRELLASAMTLAKKYVVYSTCSLEPEENDDVIAAHERVNIDGRWQMADGEERASPSAIRHPPSFSKWLENGVLRLTPESGADGFTAFVLRV